MAKIRETVKEISPERAKEGKGQTRDRVAEKLDVTEGKV